jgi:hypothetical protein
MPPLRCASATTCMASVDLPEDSGPKISMTRPRGRPPTPSATSSARAPVWMASMAIEPFSPIRMMDPLPNCLSMTLIASAIDRCFFSWTDIPTSAAGPLHAACHR